MGNSTYFGFGYGLQLNRKQQKKLKNFVADLFDKLPEDHSFRDGAFFTTNPEEIELWDALEECYQGILSPASIDDGDYKLLVFAHTSCLTGYGSEVVPVKGKGNPQQLEKLQPTYEELRLLTLLGNHVNATPSWFLYGGRD